MDDRMGRGGVKLTLETEKIVVLKWCYFPELNKMTMVREDEKEKGKK